MAFPVFNEAIPDDRKTISYDKLLFFFFFFFYFQNVKVSRY